MTASFGRHVATAHRPAKFDYAGSTPQGSAAAPQGDRSFRPDVQGLRAVAIALVVIFHAGVTELSGGYVGVDVFFVISGYVITGLLLRERAKSHATNLVHFYARRARRILPAAALTIAATVVASFHYLGFLAGAEVTSDAQSAALFVANFHFIALGTDYASSQAPPSPLQHFWSLAVEEQFYFVYPTLFMLVATLCRRISLTVKLLIVLSTVTAVSYAWSVLQTSSDATTAYFSPLTRAWELAIGGLVAVAAPYARKRVPNALAAALTWAGVAAIVASALVFNAATPFPGSLAAIPVVGTAVVIVAGTARPRLGAESVLGRAPFQWLGAISYSLYLFHWPILTIYAETHTTTPSVTVNLLLIALAIMLSLASYLLFENPIRNARVLRARPALTVVLILVAFLVTFTTVAVERTRYGMSVLADAPPQPKPVAVLEKRTNG